MIVANIDDEKAKELNEQELLQNKMTKGSFMSDQSQILNNILAIDNMHYGQYLGEGKMKDLREPNLEEISTTDYNSLGKETSLETIRNENSCHISQKGKNYFNLEREAEINNNCSEKAMKDSFYNVSEGVIMNETVNYDESEPNNDLTASKHGKPLLFSATKNKGKKGQAQSSSHHINASSHNSSANFQIVKKSAKLLQKTNCDENIISDKEDESEYSFCNEKIDYLKLLLTAADGLVEKGLTSLEEILANSGVYELDCNPLNATSEEFQIKCENESCGAIASKRSEMCLSNKSRNGKLCYLCKTCYQAEQSGQFCYYCGIIYSDNLNATYNDHKSWIQCDFCELWQHIQCEESQGNYPNISSLNQDLSFKYKCPMCYGGSVSSATKGRKKANIKTPKKTDKKKCSILGNKQGISSNESISNGKQEN